MPWPPPAAWRPGELALGELEAQQGAVYQVRLPLVEALEELADGVPMR